MPGWTFEGARMNGLRVNDVVMTPNGPGVVQGRLIDKRVDPPVVKILVAHEMRPGLPDEMRQLWRGGPFVLFAYALEVIHERPGI